MVGNAVLDSDWLDNRWVQLLLDVILVALAWWLAFWLRFNFALPGEHETMMLQAMPLPLMAFACSLGVWGVYRHIWRYTGVAELLRLVYGVVLAGLTVTATLQLLRVPNFPRTVMLLHPLLCLVMLGGVRIGRRIINERSIGNITLGKPLLLIGHVQEAATALSAIRGARDWTTVGIVSPSATENGRTLQGLRVWGGMSLLPDVVRRTGAQAALVVSAPGSKARREALMLASEVRLPLLSMPRPDEWLRNHAGHHPRRIELEDLLGREPVALDEQGLSDLMAGQTVLVTGAGGSIGSELCRQITRFGVARLVCVDASEHAMYQLERELRETHPQLQGLYYTANVRDHDRLLAIASAHPPVVMFHAAAYKHVPLMESLNEIEALRTNVLGTLNCARVAGTVGTQRFVLISTDKAVNPTNVMGASKRLAEQVVQSVAKEYPKTHFLAVRFGNVLGSSGSVVPLFSEQIAHGGPVTVTHPDIVRYFMTIPEAAQLVLQAGLIGQTSQILVLDMGEPVAIVELARLMIRLSGETEDSIPITFTGLRPGEKLYEELIAQQETVAPSIHPKLGLLQREPMGGIQLTDLVGWINERSATVSSDEVRDWLIKQVPEYQPRR
jgi:FlaA1/EpsC-like NDP-sugar epimerase